MLLSRILYRNGVLPMVFYYVVCIITLNALKTNLHFKLFPTTYSTTIITLLNSIYKLKEGSYRHSSNQYIIHQKISNKNMFSPSCYKKENIKSRIQSTSRNIDAKLIDPKQLLNSLKYIELRNQAIEDILRLEISVLQSFSRGDIKTVIAACVETSDSISYLPSFMKILQSSGLIDSEIMFVAIRLCCKRRLSATAKVLLLEVSKAGLVVDLITVNTVVQQLIHSGNVAGAIELLEIAQKKAFGERIQCDMSTFSMIIESASRLKDREMMRKAFNLVYYDRPSDDPAQNTTTTTTYSESEVLNNSTVLYDHERKVYRPRPYPPAMTIGTRAWPPFDADPSYSSSSSSNSNGAIGRGAMSDADSKMLIQALALSACVGDMATSLEIFDIMNRTSDSIPSKVYSLLMSSFLVRPLNLTEAARYTEEMEVVVWEVVAKEIDKKDILVANVLLRFLACVIRKRELSELYLGRMIKLLQYRPSALALQEYSLSLTEGSDSIDVIGSTRYQCFIQPIGVKPSQAIRQTSLHSDEVASRNTSVSLLLLQRAVQQLAHRATYPIATFPPHLSHLFPPEDPHGPTTLICGSLKEILSHVGTVSEPREHFYPLLTAVITDFFELVKAVPAYRPTSNLILSIIEMMIKVAPQIMDLSDGSVFLDLLNLCNPPEIPSVSRRRVRSAAADLGRSKRKKERAIGDSTSSSDRSDSSGNSYSYSNNNNNNNNDSSSGSSGSGDSSGTNTSSSSSDAYAAVDQKAFKGFAKKAILSPPS